MSGMRMSNGNLFLPDECHFRHALDLEGCRRRIRYHAFSLINDIAELARNKPERQGNDDDRLASVAFVLESEMGNALRLEMRALDPAIRSEALQRTASAEDLAADENHAAETRQPIFPLEKFIDSIVAKVPEEAWDKIPSDLSSKIDCGLYSYGANQE